MTSLEQIAALGALLTMTTGAVLFVAPKSDVEKVDRRITQHIKEDMRTAALRRMWMLESRYGGQVCCAGWNATDIALWKEAKAEYDKASSAVQGKEGGG